MIQQHLDVIRTSTDNSFLQPVSPMLMLLMAGIGILLVSGCSPDQSSSEPEQEQMEVSLQKPEKNKKKSKPTTVQKRKITGPSSSPEVEHDVQQPAISLGGGSGVRKKDVRPKRPVDWNREGYDHTEANPFKSVTDHPLSTFSIDVDSASYANTRRFLDNDQRPPADAVRIEELINYFDYDYPQPDGNHPFSITTELGRCPWQPDHKLLHVGLQGKQIDNDDIPPSNLVFLVDVSGSMQRPNKLPLVKKSLNLLVDQLRPEDRISMVVYAGSSGVALEPTAGDQKERIKQAISQLEAGGSTAGSKGIKLAYEQARKQFKEDGNNRVILATDGDFNVGITSDGALTRLIEKKRESGVFLSVLGFGTGNYQGGKMEKLSNKGNGNYAYIDSVLEAKKTLVREFGGSMMTIAKDVKIQLEFNPAQVKSYRLIGYVNRQLDKEDFRDDEKDAGELGSGHSVIALYQVVPPKAENKHEPADVPELKYQNRDVNETQKVSDELGTVKFRYKPPEEEESTLMTQAVNSDTTADLSNNFHWSAAVAMFGMQLRDDKYNGQTSYDLIEETARNGMNDQASDYRREFLRLLKTARTLTEASE